MKKTYQVAVVFDIVADTYDDALYLAAVCTIDTCKRTEGQGITSKVVLDYERDNDGKRVLYLPNEEE